MQNENSKLKIHTGIRPTLEQIPVAVPIPPIEEKKIKPQKVKPIKASKQKPHSHRIRTKERRKQEEGERLTAGERMIRNTAVACALLLSVMALKNVNQPWSQQATEGIRQAMTMRVDWDETLGKLSFVRALVPETALVFLNLSEDNPLIHPVQGEISHVYRQEQPWIEYRCSGSQMVSAALAGKVTAVGEGAGGDWIVLIKDENGVETVYGYLADVYVRTGSEVKAGQEIGITQEQSNGRLYFEVRENGQSIDPTERMK